ncbi:hypothetical protein QJS66_19045 [Kocuria rhizophila]|nr:hypothetical protein QJS66_19045 [Kocuria rhizophila]
MGRSRASTPCSWAARPVPDPGSPGDAAGVRVVRTYGMSETRAGCAQNGEPLDTVTVLIPPDDADPHLAHDPARAFLRRGGVRGVPDCQGGVRRNLALPRQGPGPPPERRGPGGPPSTAALPAVDQGQVYRSRAGSGWAVRWSPRAAWTTRTDRRPLPVLRGGGAGPAPTASVAQQRPPHRAGPRRRRDRRG